MTNVLTVIRRCLAGSVWLGAAFWLAGCTPEAKFRRNVIELEKAENSLSSEDEPFDFKDEQVANLDDVEVGLWGTPDDPKFPAVYDDSGNLLSVVDMRRLNMAAGRVRTDEDGTPHGLYRQHCAHCHGITGDGRGPTAAFLNPYPRDYRLGKFKFKSTRKGAKPTNDDLLRILDEGIPGTAMPSFRVLSKVQLQILVDYVKYLSIRGEVERLLIERMRLLEEEKEEANDVPRLVSLASRSKENSPYETDIEAVNEIVTQVATAWSQAGEAITEVPERPPSWYEDRDELQQQVARGRELFFTSKFNCFSCHGESAIGNGQTDFYDDWTVDIFGKEPYADPKQVRQFVALGALEPRPIRPRNLRLGVYRGGRRPIDLYRRVTNGIEGTPMPDVSTSIPPEDVWAVIEYVRQLPYESTSLPSDHKPLNEKSFR